MWRARLGTQTSRAHTPSFPVVSTHRAAGQHITDKLGQNTNPVPPIPTSAEAETIAKDIPPDRLGDRGDTWKPSAVTTKRLRLRVSQ